MTPGSARRAGGRGSAARLLPAGVLLIGVLATPIPAIAQQAFSLGRWEGRLEFLGDWGIEDSSTATRQLFDLRRRRYQQRFVVRNTGFVIGRGYLTLRGGATLGFNQERLTINEVGDPANGKLLAYDFGGEILSGRPYSLSAYATSTDNTVNREFGIQTDVETKTAGLRLNLRWLPLPSTFVATRLHTDAITRSGNALSRNDEIWRTFTYQGSRSWDRHNLSVGYEYRELFDQISPQRSYPSYLVGGRHNFVIDQRRRSRLNTDVKLFRRGGALFQKYFDLTEALTLALTDTLSTNFNYRFRREWTRTEVDVTHSLTAAISHQLYRSLSTNARISVSRARLPTGRRDNLTVGLGARYTKDVIGGGRLLAAYTTTRQRTANDFEQRQSTLREQRAEARLGVPIRIRDPLVIHETVLVSDPARAVVFDLDRDYTLGTIGDFTEISILPEGRIIDGQTILIQYRVQEAPFTRIGDRAHQFNVALDYGWITPYYRLSRTKQDLLEGEDPGFLSDRRASAYGVRFKHSWSRVRIGAMAEKATDDSKQLAFDSLRFNQFLGYQAASGMTLSVNLSEDFIEYRRPVHDEKRGLARITGRWPLMQSLSLDLRAQARVRTDTIGLDERYFDVGVGGRWTPGRLQVTGLIRRYWNRRNGTDFKGFQGTVTLARTF